MRVWGSACGTPRKAGRMIKITDDIVLDDDEVTERFVSYNFV